jgi:hypothetical protein
VSVTNPVPSVRDEIESLLCSYARGFDENDPDLLAECFAVDAERMIASRRTTRDAFG